MVEINSTPGGTKATSSASSQARKHLLWVLLDSNLPTGGFVSSSGLESWAKHGFLNADSSHRGRNGVTGRTSRKTSHGPSAVSKRVIEFAKAEVENYARTTGPFVFDTWTAVDLSLKGEAARSRCSACGHRGTSVAPDDARPLSGVTGRIVNLDQYHEACLLSHTSRRASKAQGVAMLTLYTKGFSRPPGFEDAEIEQEGDVPERGDEKASALVDEYKRLIRKGETPGHLAVCWGAITAALSIPLDEAFHLYLFLHARSLLSAAVRLNIIGPYLASQLLLHPMEDIIADSALSASSSRLNDGYQQGECSCTSPINGCTDKEADFWGWADEVESGPATSWPLGEVLISRHDLQHSRIFNS